VTIGIKPYPAYKDSGVPWLGQVPGDWTVQRLSASIADFVAGAWGGEPNGRDDTICVRVADFDRSRLRVRFGRPTIRAISPEDLRRKRLKRGDLLLEKSGGGDLQPVGVVMLYDHDEVAVCSNFVARMSAATGFRPGFLVYLHAALYAMGLNVRSIKQTTGIQNLDCRAYLSESVAFPSLPEQVAIVRYLDHADRKVRHAIRARQQLIKLLTEQKQAIIQRAVTRGLDPNARLKPSGVPWLGDVPEHWEVRSFTRCVTEIADYRGATPIKTDSGVFLVTARNVRKGRIDYEVSKEFVARTDYAKVMRRGLPHVGDLLLTMEAPLGNAALVDREDVAFAQRIVRFRFDPSRFVPDFVLRAVLSPYFQSQLQQRGTGSTALGIKASKLPELQLLCAPLEEQSAIVQYVDGATANLDKSIGAAHREIDLLREYRTRLIADVVTGKLDVRDVPVPDDETDVLPEELESIDNVEAIDQTDDVAEGDSESSSEESA
jgi:type I restriction enzyme S subunit